MTTDPIGTEPAPGRSQARHYFVLIVIGATVAQSLGLTMKLPTQLGANDISRWCTVWSLLERGTYAIDECPWQSQTQDKVKKPNKLAAPKSGDSILRRVEYAIAPKSWKEGEAVDHYYSSKPPLLPTMIAGILYPVRALTGFPLDRSILQPHEPRYVQKEGVEKPVLETPKEPVRWPAFVLYFKPIVVLLNVVPLWLFLVVYARFLDRYAANDWAFYLSLAGAAWGTLLLDFIPTLNNHTIAATSAFFSLAAFIRIWDEGDSSWFRFAVVGFFAAFTACNELPAAIFGLILFVMLLVRFPKATLLAFVPAAVIPCVAFLVTQYLAFGQFKPVYEEFGTKSYQYEGSYWNTPLEMDWFNVNPESYATYLFHMTFGHHGVFSLTPLYLFSFHGALRVLIRAQKLTSLAWLTIVLTLTMFGFYLWNPKARNYGGSAIGLRWLFWLIPFWLFFLPKGVEGGQERRWVRGLSLGALMISVFAVGYGLRMPWSHPWILDAMEHLDLYPLKR